MRLEYELMAETCYKAREVSQQKEGIEKQGIREYLWPIINHYELIILEVDIPFLNIDVKHDHQQYVVYPSNKM